MAAIDKIYVDTYDEYVCFADWCRKQLPLKDKYGRAVRLTDFVYRWSNRDDFGGGRPVFMAPYYVDAFLIRNCPFEFIQNELQLNYGDSYELIKNGELFTSPTTAIEYKVGRHFRCIKRPKFAKWNRPYAGKWHINVSPPNGFMWYNKDTNSWDFSDEFVYSKWSSSMSTCNTIRALKRLMVKWKLPVGATVEAYGRFTCDTYVFEITK